MRRVAWSRPPDTRHPPRHSRYVSAADSARRAPLSTPTRPGSRANGARVRPATWLPVSTSDGFAGRPEADRSGAAPIHLIALARSEFLARSEVTASGAPLDMGP